MANLVAFLQPELFHVCCWLAHTFGLVNRPAPGLVFDANKLPKSAPVPTQSAEQLRQLEASRRERGGKLAALLRRAAAARAALVVARGIARSRSEVVHTDLPRLRGNTARSQPWPLATAQRLEAL